MSGQRLPTDRRILIGGLPRGIKEDVAKKIIYAAVTDVFHKQAKEVIIDFVFMRHQNPFAFLGFRTVDDTNCAMKLLDAYSSKEPSLTSFVFHTERPNNYIAPSHTSSTFKPTLLKSPPAAAAAAVGVRVATPSSSAGVAAAVRPQVMHSPLQSPQHSQQQQQQQHQQQQQQHVQHQTSSLTRLASSDGSSSSSDRSGSNCGSSIPCDNKDEELVQLLKNELKVRNQEVTEWRGFANNVRSQLQPQIDSLLLVTQDAQRETKETKVRLQVLQAQLQLTSDSLAVITTQHDQLQMEKVDECAKFDRMMEQLHTSEVHLAAERALCARLETELQQLRGVRGGGPFIGNSPPYPPPTSSFSAAAAVSRAAMPDAAEFVTIVDPLFVSPAPTTYVLVRADGSMTRRECGEHACQFGRVMVKSITNDTQGSFFLLVFDEVVHAEAALHGMRQFLRNPESVIYTLKPIGVMRT